MAVITVYRGARDSMPAAAEDLAWSEIATELALLANAPTRAPENADRETQKRACMSWAPHRLAPNATRAAANVEAVTFMALDVDAGATPEDIASHLSEQCYAALVYESPSSTPATPKFRVVCPLERELRPNECAATRLAFAEWLGLGPGCGVERALDPSRIYFAGRLHGTPERRVWRVEGDPLPAEWPAPALAWGAAQAPRQPALPLATLPPANVGIAAALGAWQLHDGRKHDLCGAVGGLMRKLGFSREQCEAEIRAWLPPAEPGVDVAHGVAWACAAWDKPADAVSGHASLAALLGAEHAAVVEHAAHVATPFGEWAANRPLVAAPVPVASWVTPVDHGDPLGRASSFADPETPLEYYCEGLGLAPSNGKISLIAGQPGAGKGPIADHLAVCFTFGLPAFGRWPCQKRRTLVLDCEGRLLTMRRMRRMCRALGVDARALAPHRDVSGMPLLDDRFYAALQAEAPEVVVLDSYTSAMLLTGLDSFKPEFAQLAAMLGSLGCLVLAVAHANKVPAQGERPTLGHVAGSFALAALAQTGICVWHPDIEAAPSRVRVGCMRAPETGFATFDAEFRDVAACDGLSVEFVDAPAEAAAVARAASRATLDALAARVLAYMSGVIPKTKSAIAKDLDTAHTVGRPLSHVLSALCDAGVLQLRPSIRANAAGEYVRVRHDVTHVTFDDSGACKPAEVEAVAGFVRPPA